MSHSKNRVAAVPLALLAVGCTFQAVVAGPTWPELPPDAGSLLPGAQVPVGVGPIARIFGTLGGPAGPVARGIGDFEDMYLIKITDPVLFFASTDPADGGSANFNTELFLFTGPDHPDGPGLGMFANDDNPGAPNNESRITGLVTDSSLPPALLPGLHYYLAITGFSDVPLGGGVNIFNQSIPTELSGPDGPGGLNPINNWSGPGEFGDYEISLRGVEFPMIPSPGAGVLLAVGLSLGSSRRRR